MKQNRYIRANCNIITDVTDWIIRIDKFIVISMFKSVHEHGIRVEFRSYNTDTYLQTIINPSLVNGKVLNHYGSQ